jgi:hypothetical protein
MIVSGFEHLSPSHSSSRTHADIPEGTLEFRGADFAWGSRAWAGQPDVMPGEHGAVEPEAMSPKSAAPKAPAAASKAWDLEAGGGGDQGKTHAEANGAATEVANGIDGHAKKDTNGKAPLTLHGLKFSVAPGEFVGVAGEVCALPKCIRMELLWCQGCALTPTAHKTRACCALMHHWSENNAVQDA